LHLLSLLAILANRPSHLCAWISFPFHNTTPSIIPLQLGNLSASMLSIPPEGVSVVSAPPPSPDNPNILKNRQLVFITLNDQILSQIQASGGKGITVTFGQNAVSLPCEFLHLPLSPLPAPGLGILDLDKLSFTFATHVLMLRHRVFESVTSKSTNSLQSPRKLNLRRLKYIARSAPPPTLNSIC
jgi:hypothetical protein